MTNELIEQYFTNLQKYANNEWTSGQWADYCTAVLGELMESAHTEKLGRIREQIAGVDFTHNINALLSL